MERVNLNPRLTCSLKTNLTEDIIDEFSTLVRRGLPLEVACDYLSLPTATFWLWSRRGEQFLKNEQTPKKDTIFGMLVLAYKRALAEYKGNMIQRLNGSETNMWVRDMTILERRDRKNFSKTDPQGGAEEDYDPDERFM